MLPGSRGGRQTRWKLGRAGPCRCRGFLGAPRPGRLLPNTGLCSGPAGLSASHSLRASVCPSVGFLLILAPPLQQSSRSGVSTCRPGLGPAGPLLCGCRRTASGPGPCVSGWEHWGSRPHPGEAFPTGLHLPCVTWCLSLCSPAERSCQGFMPSPSCGLHPGRGPSSPLHSSSSREVERHPRRPHLVCEPRCLAGHCRPATRWLTVLSES